MQVMLQASVFERFALDALALGEDHLGPPDVDIGRGEIVEALLVAGMIAMLDEGTDLPFEIAGQIVVVEQDAVLQGLVSALDLALRQRVIRRTAHMLHALVVEPLGQIAGDVGRAMVAEQPWPVQEGDAIKLCS